MRKFTSFIMMSVVILLLLNGCQSSKPNEDLFHYKGSYVGDNSAVGNILHQLRGSEYVEGYELTTNTEPYGIIVKYISDNAGMSEKNVKKTVLYNATFLFALIHNVDWITFSFGDQQYKVEKQFLEEWYGKDLAEFNNEEELIKLAKLFIDDDDKINQFFILAK